MSDMLSLLGRDKDPYKVLGLSPNASPDEIKQAYFTLVKEYSPEKRPDKFKEIRFAYEQIRSQKKREETDFLLFDEGEGATYQSPGGASLLPLEDLVDLEVWRIVASEAKK